MEIAQTGNMDLIVISGSPSDDQVRAAWEEIIKKNSDQNGINVSEYEENVKTYGKLLGDYQLVQLSLMQLMMVVDENAIEFLKSKGYRIDTSTSAAYSQSISLAMQKCKNIVTKLTTKYNQIQIHLQDNDGRKAQTSLEQILANLSAGMGFSIGADITLARYNEYKKILKRKHEASKMRPQTT